MAPTSTGHTGSPPAPTGTTSASTGALVPVLAAAPNTLAARRGEIRSLTGLRLFAAAWVVVFHFHFTPGAGLGRVFGAVRPVVGLGALGVDLFYVLSGFVIAFTYLDRMGPRLDPRLSARFVWARVSRVWPVFAVLTNLFGIWLLIRLVWGADGEIAFQTVQPELTVASWLRQMFMVQLWTEPFLDGSSWLGPAWSISAEWLAYVVFPLTALVFFRMARLPRWLLGVLAVAAMLPVALVALLTGDPYFPYSWLVRIAVGFTAGVLVYLTVRHIPLTERVGHRAAAVAVALLATILVGLLLSARIGPGEHGGIVLLCFPALVGALALSSTGPSRLLSTGWAVHGGRISYSLYLVHVAVFEVVWTAMLRYRVVGPDTPGGVALAFAGLAGSFLAAHLLWACVEEPSRRGLRRLTERRAARAVSVRAQRAPSLRSIEGIVRTRMLRSPRKHRSRT